MRISQGQQHFPVRAVMPYLEQPKKGYRYSSDAVILAAFASQKETAHWADLGTGCGVLAVRLAKAWPESQGLALDFSSEAIRFARKNLRPYPVSVIHGDLRTFPWREKSLDLVVCNPPYFDAHAFRLSQNPAIRLARHALHGNIVDFAACLKPMLVNRGRFCFVFPVDLAEEKVSRIEDLGYVIHRQLVCRSFSGRAPHAVCFEFGKIQKKPQLEELTLYEKPGFYTKQAWQFLKMA